METQLLSWISSEITRTQQYHNHKENMAWLATAFYISGMFLLGNQFRNINTWHKPYIVIVITIATGLAFWFVCWQFNNRKIASQRIKRLVETAEKYIPNEDIAWYFGEIKNHHYDPEKTVIFSILAMGIAYTSFLMLVCF